MSSWSCLPGKDVHLATVGGCKVHSRMLSPHTSGETQKICMGVKGQQCAYKGGYRVTSWNNRFTSPFQSTLVPLSLLAFILIKRSEFRTIITKRNCLNLVRWGFCSVAEPRRTLLNMRPEPCRHTVCLVPPAPSPNQCLYE
jgi:hypothetical protein